ncbi:AraC family transcriptional regulator, L-rhamnose operon regulatory protein RhaS [Devosia crocina]|uniref:AraC family transcriptional regulator, L-rhamnose operon regulatory protein RhaS n=1 Tax=Devosia crocina TaxID=429728 RepID=A0A1I7NRU0_9HYPH|nr:AraC family transcriptional regulator [Devosia crocina]SFV37373.1 AraC family transcriptional regulator, L-rhamnose operon regulatory protein RhaS [Devosia crocina]
MNAEARQKALSRPAVFTEPGALMYAGNCADLFQAALEGKVTLNAWTRRKYPGKPLGDALPQVLSVGGWDAARSQDWGLKEHCNEGVKIAYLARGSMVLKVDGQRHELTEGQMFVVRPWQLHQFGDPHVSASQIIWVLFDVGVRRPHEDWLWPDWMAWPERDTARLTTLLSRNEQHVLNASREVARSFHDIAELVAGNDITGSETRLRLLISLMLLQFTEQLEHQSPVLDEDLASSKRTVQIFLDRLPHALDEQWTLDNMATECSLSRTQFSQHCQALTNMTPVRYLQMVRLEAAKRWLSERATATVTDIALEAGFTSSQYFATCFKRRFGLTPQECRR